MTPAPALVAVELGASAGPIGLLIVLLLGVATVLLIRNMDKRVKRLPPEFAPPPPERGPDEQRPAGPDLAH